VPVRARIEEVDGLLSMVLHDQTHYAKMIQNLLPLLSSLTSGDLGPLLSPDAADINDPRPVFDSDKIIKGRHVVYVGLDSLSDPTVGSAIGSIVIADLAAVAGDIYNYGRKQNIELFVDEVAECVNTPLIQVLNKGRGSGFRITLAAQTLPDIVAKLGDQNKARMVIGNCNNLIALRTKDRLTQDFVVETFGQTHVQTLVRTQATGMSSKAAGVHVTGSVAERLGEERVDVFAPEWLGMLPSLHYIAMVSGGRLVKGRLPKIKDEAHR
jgi:conjugal transfer pilus assembly protein TraD